MTVYPKHLPPGYIRMHRKAGRYLDFGPEIYRRADALHKPEPSHDEDVLARLKLGMQQILQFAGTRPEEPFEHLGIHGFYALMDTLHYGMHKQELIQADSHFFLDRILFTHLVTDEPITLYNRVPRPQHDDQPVEVLNTLSE
jgi:hypothetical protein